MPRLYVVATPIGNLNDMSPRMQEALMTSDLIAAEDTRVTMKLLNRLDIRKPMCSCHRHNEDMRADALIARMQAEDLTVALVCDAGTPAVSDPGQYVVAAAWAAGIEVIPISGPCAAITALSASGFDTREFTFLGFLPREKKALCEKLQAAHAAGQTVSVIYESPHRIEALVATIAEQFPTASLLVCCDLTKKYEKILRGRPQAVLSRIAENPNAEKGEYCVVLDWHEVPAVETPVIEPLDAETLIIKAMLAGATLRDAAAQAMDAGLARNEVYRAKLNVAEFLCNHSEE